MISVWLELQILNTIILAFLPSMLLLAGTEHLKLCSIRKGIQSPVELFPYHKIDCYFFFGMLQSTFGPLGAYWQRCFLIDQSFQGNIVITSIVGA